MDLNSVFPDINDFISNSNLIDPQYYPDGSTIPGAKKGDLLYDNHVDALELAIELMKNPQKDLCLKVHRELTKNIPFFEDCGGSGTYRPYNMRIGNESLPDHTKVKDYTERLWIPMLQYHLSPYWDINEYEKFSWELHYAFEIIHPFIDGNGRCGRILLNAYRIQTNIKPVVIYYDDRWDYYRDIQNYKKNNFENFLEKGELI
jgi:fido (protein-threonine AMPylation protein)